MHYGEAMHAIQVAEWKDLSDVGRAGATPTLL